MANPVELGFVEQLDQPECMLFESADWTKWEGGLTGSSPVWLSGKPSECLTCGNCDRELHFLCQVYCPLEDDRVSLDAFHRCLYVFVCRETACQSTQHPVCVRQQLPKENTIYSSNPESFDQVAVTRNRRLFDQMQAQPAGKELTTDEQPPAGLSTSIANIQLDPEQPDESVDADLPPAPAPSSPAPAPANPPPATDAKSSLPRFDIVIETEPEALASEGSSCDADKVKHVQKCFVCKEHAPFTCAKCKFVSYCSKEHQRQDWKKHKPICNELVEKMNAINNGEDEDEDEDMTQEMLDQMAHGGSAQLQELLKNKDPVFLAFQDRVKREPEQCFRYSLWPEKTVDSIEDNGVLWYSSSNQPKQVPACENCGSERKFELQVMPQLLYHLGDADMDWGTLVVYTCTKSCSIPESTHMAREFVCVNH